jgi:hypothetical protein
LSAPEARFQVDADALTARGDESGAMDRCGRVVEVSGDGVGGAFCDQPEILRSRRLS